MIENWIIKRGVEFLLKKILDTQKMEKYWVMGRAESKFQQIAQFSLSIFVVVCFYGILIKIRI